MADRLDGDCITAMLPAKLQITLDDVVARLRLDLPGAMVGSVLLAIGLGAVVLYRLRERDRDRALVWFGVFAILYSIRTLLDTRIIQLAIGSPEKTAEYFISAITYIIGLPLLLMLWEVFPSWRRTLRILLWILSAFAVAGITFDLVLREPRSLNKLNSAIVLVACAAFLISVFRQKDRTSDVKLLRWGLLIYTVTVIAANLRPLIGWRMVEIEPIGLLILLISVGHVLARRAYRNNERLVELDKELDIAWRIQMSILPESTPTGPHWDIAAHYVPMTAVAGDFYDFLIVDDHRVGILVADVSGHGVPAALIASMVKIAIAAQLPHADNPAKVLAGINQTLCGNSQGQYVTAAYLYLDLPARKMRYAAAAHPAILWQHTSGQLEEVTENGLMLGLFPAATYSECECDLQPGDRFLLYTDGLSEAENRAGEFFGSERVMQALGEFPSQPLHHLVNALADRVSRWSASAQDDLTMVAVGWHPASRENYAD